MPVSPQLRRLLRLRTLEEQNQRVLLGLVMAQLHQLEAALEQALSKERSGRSLVRRSVLQRQIQDRHIGLLECSSSSACSSHLCMRIEQASARAAELRAEVLRKYREKEQIQLLLQTQLEREMADSVRKLQFQLDEWARSRWSDANDRRGLRFSSVPIANQSDNEVRMREASKDF